MIDQLLRYGAVGIFNNLLGYFLYILLTWLWIEPKMAVILLYPIGAITSYFGHAKYVFSFNGRYWNGFARFVISHCAGFGINIGILYLFWNLLGYPHQLVQAFAILIVASVLFLLFRYFVFDQGFQP